MSTHLEYNNRDRENETNPEATPHIDEFATLASFRGGHFGFERHAADWAMSRTDLANLWMHRAGINCAR